MSIKYFFQEVSGDGFYARCMNLERVVKKAYDDALEKYDVIVMPTLPYVARKLNTEEESPKSKYVQFELKRFHMQCSK